MGRGRWSPDGQLTFGDVPEALGVSTGSEVVHIYDRAHGISDVPDSKGLWSSRWSPDGRYIAALTIKDGTLAIFDVRAHQWRMLDVHNVDSVTWSHDSRSVHCDPRGPEYRFRRVRVADGAIDYVIDLRDHRLAATGAGIAADGAPLFLWIPIDLYAIELERRR